MARKLKTASDVRQISKRVEHLVSRVFPSTGLLKPPHLIDVSEDSSGIWFHFSMKLKPVKTAFLRTRANTLDIEAPVKFAFPVTERYLYRYVEAVLSSIFQDVDSINIGDWPEKKVSYVSSSEKRMGDKPILYYEDEIVRFDFRISPENEMHVLRGI